MANPDDWKLPWEGGCRCDQVRFRVTAPPVLTAACHCAGCQRMSASAFSLSVGIPSDGFEIIAGSTVIGGLHGASQHNMCPRCMSWMFTRADGMPFVNLRATMLDDHRWFTPFIDTYTSEKLAWATTPAKYHYPEFPPMEAYPSLLAEFAQSSPRP